MILAQVFSIFIVFILVLTSFGEDKVLKVHVKAVQCSNVSSKFIYSNYSCFAKSYNRSFSTVNVDAVTKQPLNHIQVIATILVRSFYQGFLFTFSKARSQTFLQIRRNLSRDDANTKDRLVSAHD